MDIPELGETSPHGFARKSLYTHVDGRVKVCIILQISSFFRLFLHYDANNTRVDDMGIPEWG